MCTFSMEHIPYSITYIELNTNVRWIHFIRGDGCCSFQSCDFSFNVSFSYYSRPSLIRIPLIRTLANLNPTFNDIHSYFVVCSIGKAHC